jgi:hypothetical protein
LLQVGSTQSRNLARCRGPTSGKHTKKKGGCEAAGDKSAAPEGLDMVSTCRWSFDCSVFHGFLPVREMRSRDRAHAALDDYFEADRVRAVPPSLFQAAALAVSSNS